jgi:hypothetical protein
MVAKIKQLKQKEAVPVAGRGRFFARIRPLFMMQSPPTFFTPAESEFFSA